MICHKFVVRLGCNTHIHTVNIGVQLAGNIYPATISRFFNATPNSFVCNKFLFSFMLYFFMLLLSYDLSQICSEIVLFLDKIIQVKYGHILRCIFRYDCGVRALTFLDKIMANMIVFCAVYLGMIAECVC